MRAAVNGLPTMGGSCSPRPHTLPTSPSPVIAAGQNPSIRCAAGGRSYLEADPGSEQPGHPGHRLVACVPGWVFLAHLQPAEVFLQTLIVPALSALLVVLLLERVEKR